MRGSGYWSFLDSLLRPWKLTQSRSKPSFFFTNRTGAAWGEDIRQMKPKQRFSLMKAQRASSSMGEREYSLLGGGEVPSSSSILRSYSQCRVRTDAFALLKMSAKSWYSLGTTERSGLSLAKAA